MKVKCYSAHMITQFSVMLYPEILRECYPQYKAPFEIYGAEILHSV
jgi:hypothetical protein